MAPAQSLDDHARLSALIIKGRNGTVFDLSPVFQPDVSQYGAMVGANCKDVTLCFDTLIGTSAMTVHYWIDLFFPCPGAVCMLLIPAICAKSGIPLIMWITGICRLLHLSPSVHGIVVG